MRNHLLENAQYYAKELGWYVFPIRPKRKEPLTAHGWKDATTDRQQIKQWWRRWPNANIAVACSRSNLFVLDIDGEKAYRTLRKLEGEFGVLPDTCVVQTARGEHFYFDPGNRQLRNTAGKLGRGLDTRGIGGYVLVPPSVHPTGHEYTWKAHPDTVEVAPAPEWLVKLMVTESQRDRSPGVRRRQAPMVSDEMIREGTRNHMITRMAGSMLRRYIDPEEVLDMCRKANEARCQPPLHENEVERIVNSICGSELRRRRGR